MTRKLTATATTAAAATCPTNPFVAPRVTHGMLLGEDDFRVLVGYPRGKHLLHQAWLHGTGVIWGYPVCGTGLWELEVGPGLAVDPMGRDLIHEACERLDLREVRDRAIADGWLEETSSKDADCRTARVWACVVAEFDGCLSSPVPTLADPCDVTRSYDDYSRVLERARIDIRLGRCPDPDGLPRPADQRPLPPGPGAARAGRRRRRRRGRRGGAAGPGRGCWPRRTRLGRWSASWPRWPAGTRSTCGPRPSRGSTTSGCSRPPTRTRRWCWPRC